MNSTKPAKAKPLEFPHKQIRSKVIADYVRAAGYRGVVVFSCGNASAALRDQGLEVVEVGPRGDLDANKWWTMAEIHRAWPDLFDATSGHLPNPLMFDIAQAYRAHLGKLGAGPYSVPSGSGETILCLWMVYPFADFEPAYDDRKPETTRHPDAPLNAIVDAMDSPRSFESREETARLLERLGPQVRSMPVHARITVRQPTKYKKVKLNPARVISMYKDGKNIAEIALACGYPPNCGNNRVRRVLIAAGFYHTTANRV